MRHYHNDLDFGKILLNTYTTIVYIQLITTKETYSRQLGPPPGKSTLLYVTRTTHDVDTNDITLQLNGTFTASYFPNCHPLHNLFDDKTKQRVIQTHVNLRHIFQHPPTSSSLSLLTLQTQLDHDNNHNHPRHILWYQANPRSHVSQGIHHQHPCTNQFLLDNDRAIYHPMQLYQSYDSCIRKNASSSPHPKSR